jgi:hypothetical protein
VHQNIKLEHKIKQLFSFEIKSEQKGIIQWPTNSTAIET